MKECSKNFDRTSKECGYSPMGLLRIIHSDGALKGAKRLISKHTAGFDRQRELGRLDLTVEELIISKKYKSLFSDKEIAMCEERLHQAGYSPKENLMKTTPAIYDEIEKFLYRYMDQNEKAMNEGFLKPNAAATYITYAQYFVRWCKGDFTRSQESQGVDFLPHIVLEGVQAIKLRGEFKCTEMVAGTILLKYA